MKQLIVVDQDNYQYTLKDNENNTYNLKLEFLDIKEIPKKGDYIYLKEELLDKNYIEYNDFYYFGSLSNPSGRRITDEDNNDLIMVKSKNKKILLKRLYG